MKTLHVSFIVLIAISMILYWPSIGHAQEEKPDVYQEFLNTINNLTPNGDIQVNMGTEKQEYVVGENFEVRFMTDQPCYAVMMNLFYTPVELINSAGDRTIQYNLEDIIFLLPNGNAPDNQVEGGRVYSTKEDFQLPLKAVKPQGVGTVNFFCSPEPLSLFKTDFSENTLYEVDPQNTTQLQQLTAQLAELKHSAWNGGSVTFRIYDPQEGKTRSAAAPPGGLPPILTGGSTGKTDEEKADTEQSLFP